MGFVRALLERRALTEKDWMTGNIWSGSLASTGRDITPSESLKNVDVLACVSLLAGTIATLPLVTYRRLEPRGKERDPGHPLYSILHDRPNPEMTAVELREAMVGHLELRGNAYLNLEPRRDGSVWLWPLRADRMFVDRDPRTGDLRYLYTLPTGEQRRILPRDLMHIRGLSSDGLVGYSPVTLAREAIALGMAAEEYGGRFFGNAARPGGVLEAKNPMSPEAKARLKAMFEQAHQGLDNSHRVAVLEEGVSWKQVGMSNQDAEFLETRRLSTIQIARLFRVPPHMIGEMSGSTSWGTGIEQQSIGFVVYSLRPRLVRIEQRINADLVTEPTHFAEHLVDGLLRGDTQSRFAAYATARQWGWMSANDVRELENQNAVEGGDIYMVPLNMVPADQAGRPLPPEPAPAGRASRMLETEHRSAESRRRLARSYRRLFMDAGDRITKRETADVTRAIDRFMGQRDAAQLQTWLEDYYRDAPPWVERIMLPVFLSYGEAVAEEAALEIGVELTAPQETERFLRSYAAAFAAIHAQRGLGQLSSLARAEADVETIAETLRTRLGEWRETRPTKIANLETVRSGSAVAKDTWKRSGVRKLRWRAFGQSCPYCTNLDGKVVGIEQDFLPEGQEFQPEGAKTPLVPSSRIGHAPAHRGCDCTVVPG